MYLLSLYDNHLTAAGKLLTLRADNTVVRRFGMGDRCSSFPHGIDWADTQKQSKPCGKMSISHPSRSPSPQNYLQSVSLDSLPPFPHSFPTMLSSCPSSLPVLYRQDVCFLSVSPQPTRVGSKWVSLLEMEVAFWTCCDMFSILKLKKKCNENVNSIPIKKINFSWEANHIYSHSEWYCHSRSLSTAKRGR